MRKMIRRVGYAAVLLALFAFPGHELLLHIVNSAAAQIISGLVYTTPVVVPGSIPFNGGPQVSAIMAHGGTFTANGTTAVTITDTNLTANSVVLFGMETASSPGTGGPFMFSATPGTGFTIKSTGSDASVYNYVILG